MDEVDILQVWEMDDVLIQFGGCTVETSCLNVYTYYLDGYLLAVQAIKSSHVIFWYLKVKHIRVLLDALLPLTPGQRDPALL